jgi:ArsR family transcriptional regulator
MARETKLAIGPAETRDLCQFFGLLGDETRLALFLHLARRDENVGALCELLGLAQPTVSHHLGLLRRGRTVNAQRRGKQVVYSLNRATLEEVLTSLLKGFPGGGAIRLGNIVGVKAGRG